jgi:hypothetical protein
MPPKTIRFPDSLAEKIQAEADRLDRSFSWVVLAACQFEINATGMGQRLGTTPRLEVAAKKPASTKSRSSLAMERQRKLNEAKS